MRAWLVPLLLVGLVPLGQAQFGESFRLVIDPVPTPIRPLGPALTTAFTLEVDCSAAMLVPPGVRVEYAITRVPAWATVVVSPTVDAIDPSQCGSQMRVVRHGEITFSASDAAPAFVPDAVELQVRAQMPDHSTSAKASLPIAADYFSIVDAQASATTKRAPAGATIGFPLKITNFGNAPTKVNFEVVSRAPGAHVAAPESIVLDSKQTGGVAIARDVMVRAARDDAASGQLPFVIRYEASYAFDGALKGDSGEVSFVMLAQGAEGSPAALDEPADPSARDVAKQLPLSPVAGVASLALAALLRRR